VLASDSAPSEVDSTPLSPSEARQLWATRAQDVSPLQLLWSSHAVGQLASLSRVASSTALPSLQEPTKELDSSSAIDAQTDDFPSTPPTTTVLASDSAPSDGGELVSSQGVAKGVENVSEHGDAANMVVDMVINQTSANVVAIGLQTDEEVANSRPGKEVSVNEVSTKEVAEEVAEEVAQERLSRGMTIRRQASGVSVTAVPGVCSNHQGRRKMDLPHIPCAICDTTLKVAFILPPNGSAAGCTMRVKCPCCAATLRIKLDAHDEGHSMDVY